MNIKNNIYGIFAMGMVMATMSLTSCAGDEELSQGLDASKDKIVSPADVSFGGNVTTAEIKIQASGLWSISGKFEWFTLSKTQGSGDDVITITTKDKENISAIDTRTETLVLTTDTRQREIKVEQSPAQEVLEVVPNSIEFGTTKDLEAVFTVKNNSSWKILETQDWYTISQTEGNTNDITKNDNITISVMPKTDDIDNTHTLTITSKNGIAQTIMLTQKGLDTDISPTQDELAVDAIEGKSMLQLKGDASWMASVNVGWLTLDSYSGKGAANLGLSYTSNETSGPREAVITFSIAGGKKTKTCKVTQAVAPVPTCAKPTEDKVEKYGFTVSSSYSSVIPVTEYGIVYSQGENPQITDNKIICTDGTNPFTLQASGLLSRKTFHVRAYARNGAGIGYSEDLVVETGGVKPGQDDNPTPNL